MIEPIIKHSGQKDFIIVQGSFEQCYLDFLKKQILNFSANNRPIFSHILAQNWMLNSNKLMRCYESGFV